MTDINKLQAVDSGGCSALAGARPPVKARKAVKMKRMLNQSLYTPPPGAKPQDLGLPLGFSISVVPVSSVARDWDVSARRIRALLSAGRLSGRLLVNGYWEVFYPYRFVFGTRGPQLKRQQKALKEIAARPKRLRGDDLDEAREFMRESRNANWNESDG